MTFVRNICLAATLLVLVGCGGGGSSGGARSGNETSGGNSSNPTGVPAPRPPGGPLDTPTADSPGGENLAAPTVSIAFPLVRSFTEASSITVRGTAQAKNGGTLIAVRVNGIAATTLDNFATWQASVPLEVASNVLRIETEDRTGKKFVADTQFTVVRTVALRSPGPFALDAANNRVLVYDEMFLSLAALDLTNGKRQLLSLPQDEDTLVRRAVNVDLDSGNNRALVLDDASKAIVAIDLSDGSRRLLSPPSVDMDFVGRLIDMALDHAHNRALVLDNIGRRIIAVSLRDGTRSVFFSSSNRIADSIAIDAARNRVVACCDDGGQITFIDLENSVSTPFVSVRTGDFPIRTPRNLTIDKARNRLLIADRLSSGLLAVDLINGTRAPSGIDSVDFSFTSSLFDDAIEVDDAGSRLVANISGRIRRIDLATSGPDFEPSLLDTLAFILSDGVSGVDLSFDAARNRLLTLNERFNQSAFSEINAISLVDGKQSPLFTMDMPTSTSGLRTSPRAFAYDAANNRAFLIESGDSRLITAVNLETGTGSTLFNAGPFTSSLNGVAFDSASNRLLLSDAGMDKVLALNLSNLAAVDFAVGPPLMNPAKIIVDSTSSRLLVADSGRVLALDPNGVASPFSALPPATPVLDANLSPALAGAITDNRITIDASNNRAVAIIDGAIMAADLVSGASTTLSPVGGANPIVSTLGIAVDSLNQRAFVIGLDGLYAVDLLTGERVLYIK